MQHYAGPLVLTDDGKLTSPAMATALNRIGLLGRQQGHTIHKRLCRSALLLGPQQSGILARYGVRVRALASRRLDLDDAVDTLAALHQEVLAVARSFRLADSKRATMILREMVTVGRWLRRYRPDMWPTITKAMGGEA